MKDLDAGLVERFEDRLAEHVRKSVAEEDHDLCESGIFQVLTDIGCNASFDLKDRWNGNLVFRHKSCPHFLIRLLQEQPW